MERSLQSVLQRMGSNFLVAAFVPSMAFIVIVSLVFKPILPPSIIQYFKGDLTQFLQVSVIGLLLITSLGFTLYSLNTYIYKAFEGYTFILGVNSSFRHSFLKRQASRFKKIENERKWLAKEQERIFQKIVREQESETVGEWRVKRLERYGNELRTINARQYTLTSERNENYPPSLDLLLPSRFGNILRAAELYPGSRYTIDAVPLWGRMAHVIPEDSMEKVDQANNQCSFLLNAALLSSIFSVLSFLAAAYQGLVLWACLSSKQLLYFIAIDQLPSIYEQRIGIYIVLALLGCMVAWFFYEASLLNVTQYGDMIRTAYDLYRFRLLEALHLSLPNNLLEERELWRCINNFVIGNDRWEEFNYSNIERESPPLYMTDIKYNHAQETRSNEINKSDK
jgi:hypothetical protein